MSGIQETRELLMAVDEVALVLVDRFKDGVSLSDFAAFWDKYSQDEAFKAVLQAAWDKHQAIPEEIADLQIQEIVDLALLEVSYVPRFLDALKPKAPVAE